VENYVPVPVQRLFSFSSALEMTSHRSHICQMNTHYFVCFNEENATKLDILG